MLKRFYKNNLSLLLFCIALFVIPFVSVRFLQKFLDEQIAYGNSSTGVWALSVLIFSFPTLCAIIAILFPIWVGIDKKKMNNSVFWVVFFILFIMGVFYLPFLGVVIAVWVSVGLIVSRAKITLYLFLPAAIWLSIEGGVRYVHNARTLTRARTDQSRIELMGFLTRHYTEKQGIFAPDDSEWLDQYYSFLKENRFGHWMLPEPSSVFRRHRLNKDLIGLLPEQIASDAVFVFENPFDCDCIAEDPDTIRNTEKKFIRVVTYDGNLFRYIPENDEYIPVLRKNSSDDSSG